MPQEPAVDATEEVGVGRVQKISKRGDMLPSAFGTLRSC